MTGLRARRARRRRRGGARGRRAAASRAADAPTPRARARAPTGAMACTERTSACTQTDFAIGRGRARARETAAKRPVELPPQHNTPNIQPPPRSRDPISSSPLQRPRAPRRTRCPKDQTATKWPQLVRLTAASHRGTGRCEARASSHAPVARSRAPARPRLRDVPAASAGDARRSAVQSHCTRRRATVSGDVLSRKLPYRTYRGDGRVRPSIRPKKSTAYIAHSVAHVIGEVTLHIAGRRGGGGAAGAGVVEHVAEGARAGSDII